MRTVAEPPPSPLPSYGGGFSVDGQRPTSNYLTIDGASANAYISIDGGQNVPGASIATSASGGTNGILPIDALEEDRMDTLTYTAENGRTPGGQTQVRTRGGTDEFHGSVFENFRNPVADGNPPLSHKSTHPSARRRRRQLSLATHRAPRTVAPGAHQVPRKSRRGRRQRSVFLGDTLPPPVVPRKQRRPTR